MSSQSGSQRRVLSVLSLVMITVGAVDSIRNLPSLALFGSQIVVFLVLATLLFLLPSGMIAAHLASRTSSDRGVYSWVTEALGPRWGFLAVWFQWVENVVYFPGLLSYVAATIGYMIDPALAHNRWYMVGFIWVSFWLVTLWNLRGMKESARLSNICSVLGLFLPIAMLLVMGGFWWLSGRPVQLDLHWHALMPHFTDWHIWVTVSGVMLALCGMEIATVHAGETRNPQHAFPRALLISTLIIFITIALGGLVIAMVVPHHQLSLVSGVMQYFDLFLSAYHLHGLLFVVGIALVIGGIGGLSSWIVAPIRGLQIACQQGGFLPSRLIAENKAHMPVGILLLQAVVVTIISLVYVVVPTINASYWMINVIATQLYMVMYVLMFIAAIVLTYRGACRSARYQLPGGAVGTYTAAVLGILGSVATFFIGFFPPSSVHAGHVFGYDALMLLGLVIMSVPAFWLMRRAK